MTLPLSQVLSLFRDQVWSFGGIVVAISLYLIDQTRHSRKEIAYKIISDRFRSNLSISERTTVLKIWNRGNEPISPEHYGSSIEFTFGSQASILQAQVLRTEPQKFKVPLNRERDRVTIPPILLNRKDAILLEFVVLESDDINVDVRISGNTLSLSAERDRLLAIAAKLRKFIAVSLVLWAFFFVVHIKYPSVQMLYYASLAFGFLTCILATRSIIANITALRHGPE